MSEALPPIDDEEAALAELAAMDLSLARHIHAQALATVDPEVLNGLGRTYQRVARSLRQTIMAKARLRQARERAAAQAPADDDEPYDLDLGDPDIDARVCDLQDAVGRVAAAALPAHEAEAVCDTFDGRLDFEVERPDFLTRPLDDQVADCCRHLGLPADLATRWRDLPEPPWTHDDNDDEADDAPGPTAASRQSSG